MSLQNMFALKKTKSPVSKNPYINYLRVFRLQHRELTYKEQLSEALASWRQLTADQKAAFHARNFKISYKNSNTDTEAESELTKAANHHEDDTLSNAAAMTAMVMATVSNTASNAPAATPPPTPLPPNCKNNKAGNGIKWPKIHCINCTNNTNYHQQQQQRQHVDTETPSKYMFTPENTTISVSESESNVTHLDTLARVSSWNLHFDGFYNPLEFIERLEELAQVFQLNYEQLPSMMPMLLTRKALVWYRNSQRRWSSWSAFKHDLFNFFLPAKFEEQQANAIRQRRQREGETIKNFVLSLQNLMRHTDMSEEEQLERIYESLRPELRLYVKRQDFVTLAELIALGSECEELRAQLFKCERRKSAGRGVKHAPLDHDICRRCGVIGHWARECPNQRKNYSWEYGNDYWTPVHTWYRKSDELRKRAKAQKQQQERSVSTQSSDESSDDSDNDDDNDDDDDDDDEADDEVVSSEQQRSKCPCKQSSACRPLKPNMSQTRKLRTFMHVMNSREQQMPTSERNFNSNKNNDCKSNNEPKSSHDSSTETDLYTTSSIPKHAMYIKRSKSA